MQGEIQQAKVENPEDTVKEKKFWTWEPIESGKINIQHMIHYSLCESRATVYRNVGVKL